MIHNYYNKCLVNPNALRKAKIACNFGLSECNRVDKSSRGSVVQSMVNSLKALVKDSLSLTVWQKMLVIFTYSMFEN